MTKSQAAQMKALKDPVLINDNVYVGFNAGMFEAIKKNLIKVLKALKTKSENTHKLELS